MANSTKTNVEGDSKRDRLVASAADLIGRQGVQATTLAEIAAAAEVPLGNVYYYFKTREELVAAVVSSRAAEVHELTERLDRRRSPRARLKGLTRSWAENADLVASGGCPIGTLSSELTKCSDRIGEKSGEVLGLIIDWAQAQFTEMGRRDGRELALTLVGGIQGAAVLSGAMHDPEILTDQTRRLDRWIDSLA